MDAVYDIAPRPATAVASALIRSADARRGTLYGGLAIACFALTPVATRMAVHGGIHPLIVGAGRASGAGLCAGAVLLLTRQPWPKRSQCRQLIGLIAGLAFGFPLLSAWAMKFVPAAHVAAIFGLLPLATAVVAAIRGGERPGRRFWFAGLAGSLIVTAYSWAQGGGRLQPADLALFGAVLSAAWGYAEGAIVARSLGGWQTISWTCALAAPGTGLVVLGVLAAHHGAVWQTLATGGIPPSAWLGFAYVTIVSQWLGFFPWYRALTLGGTAKISQLQLLMPFATLVASALLLGERLPLASVLTALAVCAAVAIGRRSPHAQDRGPTTLAADL